MDTKFSTYAVLLLALSAAGEEHIPSSIEGRVNNFRDHHAPIISTKKDHSVENVFTGCGKVIKRFRRIVEGRNSQFGKHPWQAALYKSNPPVQPYCGGTLLTDRWVITAGHCVDNIDTKTVTVRLGENDTKKLVEKLPHKDYRIENMVAHPENERLWTRIDLALLKLDKIVRFDQHIIPACLPPKNLDLSGRKATVSGWGREKEGNIESKPSILKEAEVEVFSQEICEQWYRKTHGRRYIFPGDYLCAGQRNGGQNTCKGDSGGPLTITINDRRVLIGVVMSGKGCGKEYFPGQYMNVTKYLNWINAVIEP